MKSYLKMQVRRNPLASCVAGLSDIPYHIALANFLARGRSPSG
jgi:hypothetical protein